MRVFAEPLGFARVLAQCSVLTWLVASTLGSVSAKSDEIRSLNEGGLPFQFINRIGGFEISGIWYPSDSALGRGGLTGPAVFVLKNDNTGALSTISENSVSLLNDMFWSNSGIDQNAALQDLKAAVTNLKSLGVLQLPYSEADRARMAPCPSGNGPCLLLGAIPIDLQDLNFDGSPDIVIRQVGVGQRDSDAYRVKTCSLCSKDQFEYLPLYDEGLRMPLAAIDSMSEIRPITREIEVTLSSGICLDRLATFVSKKDDDRSFFYRDRETIWDRGKDGNSCFKSEYRVTQSSAGFDVYKLISRKKDAQ